MALLRRTLVNLSYCLTQTVYNTPVKVPNRAIKRWVAPTLRELERRRKKMESQPLQPRTSYLEWNYDAEIYAFAKRLGETFDDALLRRAFVHRTYVIQQEIKGNETDLQDNRELINEGESFVIDCIKKHFQNKYLPDVVNALQSYLTSESMLSHVASHMGVKDLILSADFPVEKSTLSNTFKAVVAALRQSTDEKRATAFINDFLICQLNGKDIFDVWDLSNPYEYLLRVLKEKGYSEVEPRLCNQSAANTVLANYQVGLYSNKKLLGIGWGESIEIAKDTAALDAIQKLQSIDKI
ncbi:hypothetical protein ILUMI_23304 [Ignelater luminosus]|uniref:Large ribosomal subunit protein mL44 n=1 Tax=Ignelater luminosus TaxID=2038154 RepID=A0A8K0FZP3_IGNLU|nr:hypothetical protein ILUMI_23304 [Ignelater luminosus]